MKDSEQIKCSFCGRPRRLALYMVTGPGGRGICDLCVLEAESRPAPQETGTWGASCSFCGRNSDLAPLILMNEEAGICSDCVQNSRKIIRGVIGDQEEFLSGHQEVDAKAILAELTDLALLFEKHFNDFRTSFEKEDIDWNAHNFLAQTITPMKSKAGRLHLKHLSELLWEAESLFQSIRFDDIEANRPSVVKLGAAVETLLKAIAELKPGSD